MIHAFIGFEDNLGEKSHDIVASVLKRIISSDDIIDLSEFSEFSNLYAEIKHIYTFSNLLEKGHLFKQGEIIPKTNFGTSHPAYSKKGKMRQGYKLVKAYQNVSKQVLCMKYKATEKFSFSNWEVSGTFDIVKNSKNMEYIYARKNTKMFNKAFGQYVLEDNKTYIFHYTNAMEGDTRKRNDDWWFSKLRFEQLLASKEFKDQQSLISEIVENI